MKDIIEITFETLCLDIWQKSILLIWIIVVWTEDMPICWNNEEYMNI